MDRLMVYPGAIPLETDLLKAGRHGIIGLGAIASALFGTTTTANGLAVTATSPASMSVQVASGQIYAVENLDDTAFSSLAADTTHQIVKQGINLDAVTLACPAPTTAGYSIAYLIEATFQESDLDTVVLPYYNATTPTAAYSGPANSGTSQPTRRHGAVVLTAKPGVAAATGSQAAPAADTGYIALCIVTVPYGATTITASMISPISTAPIVPPGGILAALQAISYASRADTAAGTSTTRGVTPDGIAQAVQGGSFLYAVGAGSATVVTASLAPAPAALQAGMELVLKCSTTNTGAATLNLNTLGAKPITYNGSALTAGLLQSGQLYLLIYDGAAWQLQTPQIAGVVKSVLAVNGYRLWSNGQIDQWGTVALGSGGTGVIAVAITFPTRFQTAVYSLTGNADGSANPGWTPIVVTFPDTTLTGSNVTADSGNSTSTGHIDAGRSVRWDATGV